MCSWMGGVVSKQLAEVPLEALHLIFIGLQHHPVSLEVGGRAGDEGSRLLLDQLMQLMEVVLAQQSLQFGSFISKPVIAQ